VPTERKNASIEDLRRRIQAHPNLFFTDFRGLTVGELRTLRRALQKQSSSSFMIVKNTLFGKAVSEEQRAQLAPVLQGPTGVAFTGEDIVGAAKALTQFANDSKKLRIKAGLLDGSFYDPARIEALSKVPPRKELIAKMLGSLKSPLHGIVSVLGGNHRKLVYLLQALHDKRKEAAPPAEASAEPAPAPTEVPTEGAPAEAAPAAAAETP